MFFLKQKKASSIMEFVMVFLVVMGAMLIFQNAFGRAIAGRWRSVGDSFGFGRQYSAKRTMECAVAVDPDGTNDQWYSVPCADSKNCVRWDYNCLITCAGVDPRCEPGG